VRRGSAWTASKPAQGRSGGTRSWRAAASPPDLPRGNRGAAAGHRAFFSHPPLIVLTIVLFATGTHRVGVALFIVGGALRLWPVSVLGHAFSGLVAIQPGHRLVAGRSLRCHPPPELPGVEYAAYCTRTWRLIPGLY
jgi:hypothetical protein